MTATVAAAPDFRRVETVRRVAPFGVGLWDTISHQLIGDGIEVRVFRGGNVRAAPPVLAAANRHGIFVPHDLLGAAAFDDPLRQAVSPPETLLVEVRDTQGRYTSFVMQLTLPLTAHLLIPPYVDLLEMPFPHVSSPPTAPVYVPLYPLPSRRVPAGMAVVRATLVDVIGPPAAFAVLEVREAGRLLARGIADDRGEVATVFAYPEMAAPPHSSPPSTSRLMVHQSWPLQLVVRYRRHLPLVRTDPDRPALPDLGDVLGQDVAQLAGSPASGDLTLVYGREAVGGADPAADPGGRRAELLISPA